MPVSLTHTDLSFNELHISLLSPQEHDAKSPGWPDSHGEDSSVLCYCGNTSTSPCNVSGCEADCGCPWPSDQSHFWLHTDHLQEPWHPCLRKPGLQEPQHRYHEDNILHICTANLPITTLQIYENTLEAILIEQRFCWWLTVDDGSNVTHCILVEVLIERWHSVDRVSI